MFRRHVCYHYTRRANAVTAGIEPTLDERQSPLLPLYYVTCVIWRTTSSHRGQPVYSDGRNWTFSSWATTRHASFTPHQITKLFANVYGHMSESNWQSKLMRLLCFHYTNVPFSSMQGIEPWSTAWETAILPLDDMDTGIRSREESNLRQWGQGPLC